ncbi:MAG: PDZ domain-containing protein [Minicystis sp.]
MKSWRERVLMNARLQCHGCAACACAACAGGVNKAGASFSDNVGGPGARVQTVTTGGPFHRAGIDAGDIILSLNNVSINSARDAYDAVAAAPRGVPVSVTVIDVKTGQSVTLWVTF